MHFSGLFLIEKSARVRKVGIDEELDGSFDDGGSTVRLCKQASSGYSGTPIGEQFS